jgi:hypothetical protein
MNGKKTSEAGATFTGFRSAYFYTKDVVRCEEAGCTMEIAGGDCDRKGWERRISTDGVNILAGITST